ncbi:MAG: LuxR C-terminal-related transcriptional regulator [Oscillospiraceae bacterium]|jgi:LuxR family maltose regulon positive regulatory protein|nr:LuxR C-terminal-related transcriptional regulator [Oscillospiraceae bacterium]
MLYSADFIDRAAPPQGTLFLRRPRLNALLKKAVQKNLTIIVAGAGYGKSATVYNFLNDMNIRSFWMYLTEDDNSTVRFWENFVRAVAQIHPEIASVLNDAGFPETSHALGQIRSAIQTFLKPDHKTAVVLEDFHLISEKRILYFVERMLQCWPNHVSFIITTRSEPPFNTMNLLTKELITKISEPDLVFSEEETGGYFNMLGIRLSPFDLKRICEETEGWIFALRLISLAVREGARKTEQALTAMKHNIDRLMESAFFASLPDAVKKDLVKLSLPDWLPFELVQDITADVSSLENILSVSAFIRYNSFSDTVRIHHLYQIFLRGKQDILTQEERLGVYQKAAACYYEKEDYLLACAYYEKARNWPGLAGAIWRICLARGNSRGNMSATAEFILGLLAKIPESAYDDAVDLYILNARAYMDLKRFKDSVHLLESVIEKHRNVQGSPQIYWLLSECYYTLGYNDLFAGLVTGAENLEKYLAEGYKYYMLSGGLQMGETIGAFVSSYVNQQGPTDKKGEFDKRNENFNRAVHFAIKGRCGLLSGVSELANAELAYYKADMKTAEREALQSCRLAHGGGQIFVELRTLMFLLKTSLRSGHPETVLQYLKSLKDMSRNPEFRLGHRYYEIGAGWLYAAVGRPDLAADNVKCDYKDTDANAVQLEMENITRIRLLLAEQNHFEAWSVLNWPVFQKRMSYYFLGQLDLEVMRAVCLFRMKEKETALKALERAYTISVVEGFDMPFIEMGKDMRALAAHAMKSRGLAIPAEWLDKIHTKASSYAKQVSFVAKHLFGEPADSNGNPGLSGNEVEILRDIYLGLSRSEIAANHNLSLNTVKTYVGIIYSKLGANTLPEAIQTATRLNLL